MSFFVFVHRFIFVSKMSLMKKICFWAAFVLLAACKTAKPIDFAKECADRFPLRADTVHLITEVVKIDTFIQAGDTSLQSVLFDCPPSEVVRIVEKLVPMICPTQKTIVKTVTLTDSVIVYMENTARLLERETQLETQKQQYAKQAETLAVSQNWKKRFGWAAGFGWFLILLVAFLYYIYSKQKRTA